MLLGNKTDLPRSDDFVSPETERRFAEAHDLVLARRTSAMTGEGLGELLDSIVDDFKPDPVESSESTVPLVSSHKHQRRRKCCGI